jgi:hypothetical protein
MWKEAIVIFKVVSQHSPRGIDENPRTNSVGIVDDPAEIQTSYFLEAVVPERTIPVMNVR